MKLGVVAKLMLGENDQFAQIVRAILAGNLLPSRGADLFGDFEFCLGDIQDFLHQEAEINPSSMTVPELAKRLSVKQEVAYHLVRTGHIVSREVLAGRRRLRLIDLRALEIFEAQYQSGVNLAKSYGTSPKSLREILRGKGIHPAIGPDVDGCRQYFYRRSEIESHE